MTHKQLMHKLKELHMVSPRNVPVTFPAFKNRAMIRNYEKNGQPRKVVFIGMPLKSMFGFYVEYGTDMEVMREAYAMYLRLVNREMLDYEEKRLQWGIQAPATYRKMPQK